MAKRLVADSCFWFALFEPRDQYHRAATSLQEQLTVHDLIVPWPTLYEALNTRLVRRPDRLARFKAIIERSSTTIVEDGPYRNDSLRFVMGPTRHTYSLVDHVIRSMIEDRSLKLHALLTFNPKDFHDVCSRRGITLLSE